jgi:hypothetical protein
VVAVVKAGERLKEAAEHQPVAVVVKAGERLKEEAAVVAAKVAVVVAAVKVAEVKAVVVAASHRLNNQRTDVIIPIVSKIGEMHYMQR